MRFKGRTYPFHKQEAGDVVAAKAAKRKVHEYHRKHMLFERVYAMCGGSEERVLKDLEQILARTKFWFAMSGYMQPPVDKGLEWTYRDDMVKFLAAYIRWKSSYDYERVPLVKAFKFFGDYHAGVKWATNLAPKRPTYPMVRIPATSRRGTRFLKDELSQRREHHARRAS